jgi:perosamine synthetase
MIPVCEPFLNGNEKKYVNDCIESGWISSSGKYIDIFELVWACYCHRSHGVAVSSGTTALDTAVWCLGIKPGDEIIMPSFTIISCATAAIRNGNTPVLVDCDPETWTMNVEQVAEKITRKTKAIMPVHIYGHPVDMKPITDLAEDHHIAIIEDAAEAHGAESYGKRCGSFGDISCFSFYANKIVTAGEGGMVLTDSDTLDNLARSYRNLCFQPKQRFLHEHLGMNYRMTNIQAAIGVAQIEQIDNTIVEKRLIAHEYTKQLYDIPGLQLPVEKPWAKNVYWMYGIVLPDRIENTECAKFLKHYDIETRPFFLGMHEQPALRNLGLFKGEVYPVTEHLARHGLYLPSGLSLRTEEIKFISDKIREVLS